MFYVPEMYMPNCCTILSVEDHMIILFFKFSVQQLNKDGQFTRVIAHEDYLPFYLVHSLEGSHNNWNIDRQNSPRKTTGVYPSILGKRHVDTDADQIIALYRVHTVVLKCSGN